MNIYSSSQFDEIIEELKNGNTIAFGTDTVFGLACDIDNEKAINKVYSQKKRDFSKKLPMMFSNIEMMGKYVEISEKVGKLISKFSPGPITYILKKKSLDETLACRIPNDNWIIELIERYKKPLFVTSANISGQRPLYKYEEVIKELKEVDVIVKKDANGNEASTIVDVVNNFNILREGPITQKEIEDVISENII